MGYVIVVALVLWVLFGITGAQVEPTAIFVGAAVLVGAVWVVWRAAEWVWTLGGRRRRDRHP